jgi:hypothetical protein
MPVMPPSATLPAVPVPALAPTPEPPVEFTEPPIFDAAPFAPKPAPPAVAGAPVPPVPEPVSFGEEQAIDVEIMSAEIAR